jgi:hypothetical protein
MDSDLPDIKSFLRDDAKDNLVVYEVSFFFIQSRYLNHSYEKLEFNKIDDPNENFRAYAKSQRQCPCRLWFILFLVNLAIITILTLLILLLLIEIGPVRKLN